jgi:hypothetical protein
MSLLLVTSPDALLSDRGCCIVRAIGRSVKDGAMHKAPRGLAR